MAAPCFYRADRDQDEHGFRQLLQLRRAGAEAERREADAIAAISGGVRRAAARPQWMEKRAVPTLGSRTQPPVSDIPLQSRAGDAAPSAAEPVRHCIRAPAPRAAWSVNASKEISPRAASLKTRSGWGNVGGKAVSARHDSFEPRAVEDRAPASHRLKFPRGVRPSPGQSSGSSHGVQRAELEALQRSSLAEDEALLQQLARTPQDVQRPRSVPSAAPRVPKPSEVPPSLRAWRRHRHLEASSPGAGQQEQRAQIDRMKNSLNELQSEIRQLQDLMEEDALELVENVQTIRDEVRLARMRRNGATPATTAGPSAANSFPSSAASSRPVSPRAPAATLGPAEIRNAMLRAASESVAAQVSTDLSSPRAPDRPLPVLSMKPLPVSLLSRLSCRIDTEGSNCSFARALMLVPGISQLILESINGASSLALACMCSAGAVALHSRAGLRCWPHVEIVVKNCRPDEVVRAVRSSLVWDSVRSLSLYGATDIVVEKLLEIITPKVLGTQFGELCHITALRLRCTNKGSAAAVQTRRQHGDNMGIGEDGFCCLAKQLSASPVHSSLQELDVSWNHLADRSMEALRTSWPRSLSRLCLCWNFIGGDGAAHLATAIADTSARALTSLDLRSNPLGDSGVSAICEAVAIHEGLRSLGIGETLLTDEGACSALPLLRRHPTLSALDLGENILTDAACRVVADLVATAPVLGSLVLRGFLFEQTRISDAGGQLLAAAIAQRISSCIAMKGHEKAAGFHLDLDYQQVGCGTAAEMASCCGAWTRLSLLNTEVSTMGAMALANGFRQRPELAAAVKLNVAQCRISSGAVQLLRGVSFARLDSHGQRGHVQR